MAPFLGVSARRCRDDYTPSTLVEAEFYIHWNRNTVDFIMLPVLPSPQDSSRFLMHVLDNHSSAHTSASEQDIHFRERKKSNSSSKNNGIHCSARAPLSRTCWTSGTFNGLLKTQRWRHLGDNTLESWSAVLWDLYDLKEQPSQGAVSTHSPKAHLDLRTKWWKWIVISHLQLITHLPIFFHPWGDLETIST